MLAPKNVECEKGGFCSFKLHKKGYWLCRRCRKKVEVSTELDETTLKAMRRHTAAPWVVDPTGPKTSVNSVSEKHIAMTNYFLDKKGVVSVTGKEHSANALLIASAPLLLAEVLKLREEIKKLKGGRKVARRVVR